MCGILAVFDSAAGKDLRTKAIKCSKKLRHRGPDWSGAVTRHNINEPIPNPLEQKRPSAVGAPTPEVLDEARRGQHMHRDSSMQPAFLGLSGKRDLAGDGLVWLRGLQLENK